jgi:hypothetical protein
MTPQNGRLDQFGRPAMAATTNAICAAASDAIRASMSAPITGSVWPTRTRSDWAALDTSAH